MIRRRGQDRHRGGKLYLDSVMGIGSLAAITATGVPAVSEEPRRGVNIQPMRVTCPGGLSGNGRLPQDRAPRFAAGFPVPAGFPPDSRVNFPAQENLPRSFRVTEARDAHVAAEADPRPTVPSLAVSADYGHATLPA